MSFIKLKEKIIRRFSLKGSWGWAVVQMCRLEIVTRHSEENLKYMYDINLSQGIRVSRSRKGEVEIWDKPRFYPRDFFATDWEIFKIK